MSKQEPHEQSAGVCPCCGEGGELDYDEPQMEPEYIRYPWVCRACKASGRETHSVQFAFHTVN